MARLAHLAGRALELHGALQTLSLCGVGSLTCSLDVLVGCAALKSLDIKEHHSFKMDKLTSMPDLSALTGLKVKGLPVHLQGWKNGGRKRFPPPEAYTVV